MQLSVIFFFCNVSGLIFPNPKCYLLLYILRNVNRVFATVKLYIYDILVSGVIQHLYCRWSFCYGTAQTLFAPYLFANLHLLQPQFIYYQV